MGACLDFNGGGLIYSGGHPAGCKAFPNQLVQTEQVALKGFFYNGRCQRNVCWPDCLMGILDFTIIRFRLAALGHIIRSIMSLDEFPCSCICLVRNTGGIRTQVCDKSQRPMSLYLNAFIQLLGKTHGLLCGKIKGLGRFLLQGTGGEGNRRLLNTLSFFHFLYLISAAFQFF